VSGDIVERLRVRAYCWCADLDPCQTCWERQEAAEEIVRLRAAGDALAEVADEWPELVEAWQEARRDR
jgi:hypothetical protein